MFACRVKAESEVSPLKQDLKFLFLANTPDPNFLPPSSSVRCFSNPRAPRATVYPLRKGGVTPANAFPYSTLNERSTLPI